MFPEQRLRPVTCHSGLVSAASVQRPPHPQQARLAGQRGHRGPVSRPAHLPGCLETRSPAHRGDAHLQPPAPASPRLRGHRASVNRGGDQPSLLVTQVLALAHPPHAGARAHTHTCTQVHPCGPCLAGSPQASPDQGPQTWSGACGDQPHSRTQTPYCLRPWDSCSGSSWPTPHPAPSLLTHSPLIRNARSAIREEFLPGRRSSQLRVEA